MLNKFEPTFVKGKDGNKIIQPLHPHLCKTKYSATFQISLVVGADRGLGLELVRSLKENGVRVLATSRSNGSAELQALIGNDILKDIDLEKENAHEILVKEIKNRKIHQIHTYIHNAGYFTQEGKELSSLNRSEQRKMYEVCAIAPVFCTHALLSANLLKNGSKVGFITSEGKCILS